MPKKTKKQRMIRMKGTKEKDKNKIKQSVKINITTSGGGGSGGSGIPSIPQPIYNSMQGQKTGENVETNNLLKQLLKSQQPIQQPLYYINPNNQSTIPFEGEIKTKVIEKDLTDYNNQTLPQSVNRNKNIDKLETVNNNDIDDESLFINTQNLFKESEDELPTPQTPSTPMIRAGRPPLTEEQRILNQQKRENDKRIRKEIAAHDKEQRRLNAEIERQSMLNQIEEEIIPRRSNRNKGKKTIEGKTVN